MGDRSHRNGRTRTAYDVRLPSTLQHEEIMRCSDVMTGEGAVLMAEFGRPCVKKHPLASRSSPHVVNRVGDDGRP